MNTNVACTFFLAFIGIVCIQGCPRGWREYHGICYLFVRTPRNYRAAEINCHNNNGYLAEPRTAAENNFIARNINGKAYIGYSDRGHEGRFVGVHTRTLLTYRNWWRHEPNNAGNEDCTEIGFGHRGTWNDIPCHLARQSVCQLIRCPHGWRSFKDKCYLVVTKKRKYQDAENHCRRVGGFLAEPTSADENRFIGKIRKVGTAYIGYNDRRYEGHFVGVHTQTSLVYSKWWKHEPNNAGNEDCTEIGFGHSDTWNDIPCHLARQSICELNRCPHGWRSFKDKCYLVVTEKRKYQDAENHCRRVGGFLAEPTSADENRFIGKIKKVGTAYIGYNDRKREGHFVGVHTQASLMYSKWWKHEPNNAGNEDCTEIGFGHSDTWNDIPCHLARQSVCELNRCPYGWRSFKDKCYLVVTRKRNYQDAQNHCRRVGGFLAEPRSREENNFIAKIRRGKTAYIGYNDRRHEGHFVGVYTNTPLTYRNWWRREPNNLGGEDCTEIGFPRGSTWNDIPCRLARQSICELKRFKHAP